MSVACAVLATKCCSKRTSTRWLSRKHVLRVEVAIHETADVSGECIRELEMNFITKF